MVYKFRNSPGILFIPPEQDVSRFHMLLSCISVFTGWRILDIFQNVYRNIFAETRVVRDKIFRKFCWCHLVMFDIITVTIKDFIQLFYYASHINHVSFIGCSPSSHILRQQLSQNIFSVKQRRHLKQWKTLIYSDFLNVVFFTFSCIEP